MHDGQPHTRTFTHRFSGKIRLEDTLHHVGSHAVAGIADAETHAGPRSKLCVQLRRDPRLIHIGNVDTHFQHAPGVPHSMFSIGTEIHQYLVDLSLIREHDILYIIRHITVDFNRRGQ